MKYAVIKTGGKQYLVKPDQTISVEKLPQAEGETIKFSDVLLVADEDKSSVGAPTVKGAEVSATIVRQYRDRKILVVKYKPKVRYRKKQGHRQHLTDLKITSIKN
jgi:large subunit ribosomal protein L21